MSLKPQFLLDGLGAVHSEFVRISFTKTENPNKPGPVLITSQSSRDQPGADSYKYLLQPNLLLSLRPGNQENNMHIGIIGLGKMGANMRTRLRAGRH